MAAFDDLLASGFDFIVESTCAPVITAPNGVTKSGVSTPIDSSKVMMEDGKWAKFSTMFELGRAKFLAMQLDDRSVVVFNDSQRRKNLRMKVRGIKDDPADPCVILTLEEQPA